MTLLDFAGALGFIGLLLGGFGVWLVNSDEYKAAVRDKEERDAARFPAE